MHVNIRNIDRKTLLHQRGNTSLRKRSPVSTGPVRSYIFVNKMSKHQDVKSKSALNLNADHWKTTLLHDAQAGKSEPI